MSTKPPMLLLLVAVLCVALVAPAGAATDDPSEPDVVIAERTAERNVFFPTVERTHDGELLVVYYDSPSHAFEQDGRISMVRSGDDGQTWSEPEVIVDTEFDDRDPSLVQLDDGTLVLSYFRTDWLRDPPKGDGNYVTRSVDGGQTWSDPVRVETAMEGPSDVMDGPYETGMAATSDKILELDNGDLLIPIYGTLPDDPQRRASVVRSTDGGTTWPIENETFIPDEPGWSLNEPALAQTPHGEVIVMLRTHHGDGAAKEARSADRGETWSHPEATDMFAHASDLLPLRNGMTLHTWGDTSGQSGQGRPVVGRVLKRNHDWTDTDQRLLYDGSPGDQSYPSSVEISPNRFFTVYYDAPAGIIGGTYSKLSDYLRADPEPPEPERDTLDLMGMHEARDLTVDTDRTWTDPGFPNIGPLAPLDGSSDYWDSATPGRVAPPSSHFTIEFAEPHRLREVGLVLKTGYRESATVRFSSDGQEWSDSLVSLEEEVTNHLVWNRVTSEQDVRAVRVDVTDSFGEWAQLTRLELVGRQSR